MSKIQLNTLLDHTSMRIYQKSVEGEFNQGMRHKEMLFKYKWGMDAGASSQSRFGVDTKYKQRFQEESEAVDASLFCMISLVPLMLLNLGHMKVFWQNLCVIVIYVHNFI